MDTYILTEKIEELQEFLDFVSERDKQIINQWNKQQGLNPIAQIYNQNINQV